MKRNSEPQKLDKLESTAWWVVLVLFFFVSVNSLFAATQIKDITSVVGVRDNQLIGYGLVFGLNGTGDGTTSTFTTQTLANLLQGLNIQINPDDINSKNVAAVMVTAKLEPFARQGDRMTVQVASIGDADSIAGGTLLMTPLRGLDGRIYAVAQGAVSTGGNQEESNAGRVLDGAIVEEEIRFDLHNRQRMTLSLKSANLDNAVAIQNRLNAHFGVRVAIASDARSIDIQRPEEMSMVEFLAVVGNLDIQMSRPNRIVIDERSGTVVAGSEIAIQPVTVTHGTITLSVDEALMEGDGPLTVSSVTGALQRLGAEPKDVIAIMQAIRHAGALDAELELL